MATGLIYAVGHWLSKKTATKISGGWCGFDPDGEDQVEEGPWIIDPDELPNELKNDNDIAELEE